MLFRHQILNGYWAIDYGFSLNYLPLVTPWMKGDRPSPAYHSLSPQERAVSLNHEAIRIASVDSKASNYVVSEYGRVGRPEDAPEDSIAIISINGAITKQDQECGPAGMVTKSNMLQRCYANPNINGILLDIESGGGSSYGMFLMNETLQSRNKPVIGFVNDLAASAACGILTGCDLAIANSNMAQIGCIGTISTIIDYTKQLEAAGINLIEVYASQSTDKNSEFREALKGNLKPLQEKVDIVNAHFLDMIANNRKGKFTCEDKVWNTGKTFFAPDALKIGLIDAIDSFENALTYFSNF
jgi:ClpP class serine protease